LLARPRVRPAAIGLTVASLGVLAGLVILSRGQCRTWRTSEALWSHVLSHGGSQSDQARTNLGVILNDQGRTEEARTHFEQALRLNPGFFETHHNLGVVLSKQGLTEEARARFDEALRLNPSFPKAHYNLGVVLFNQGRSDEAIASYSEALRLKPDYVDAHVNLGATLSRVGRIEEALAHYSEALRLKPDNAEVYNNRAMIWASHPEAKHRDGRRAVESATRACELTGWKNPSILDTCAAAHAEAGDFETAVKWQTRAIELLADETLKDDFRSRLKLYQSRQPFHESNETR
jgi:tetratricopeptide (TPR) repeat protein